MSDSFFRAAIARKLLFVALLFCVCTPAAFSQITGLNTTIGYLRGQAQPDECFVSIGHNLPFTKPPCFFSIPKVNQAYVWAMADTGTEIWFGTVANPQCVTEAVTFPEGAVPYQTPSWVCEFNESPYASLLGVLGDFRPPEIFVYNKASMTLTNVTPTQPVSPTNPLGIDPLLYVTLGIRAAVTIGDYVFLAGQALSTTSQMNVFVFRASDHSYLGGTTVDGYDSIRQFVTTPDGEVYTAVGMGAAGAVLRYTGTNGSVQFQQIGTLNGPGAYIAEHNNSLFVTTWPNGVGTNVAGLFMSPPIPPGGFTSPTTFTQVWAASDYEPDPVVAATYGAGALASFNGYLYWGTMHVPWVATAVFLEVYGEPQTEQDWINLVLGTFRTTTIFRGTTFSSPSDIELLYGSNILPAYTPPTASTPGQWNFVPNNMPAGNQLPLYGLPGFGNPYNNYTWSMSVWNNRLWIGTMDWSFLAEQGTLALYAYGGQPVPVDVTQFFALQNFGADLFFFQGSNTPAAPENQYGLGNYTSYGVRNMISSGNSSSSLYVGMANGSNLLASGIGPQGGWELIQLEPNPAVGPLTLLTNFACAPAVETGAGKVTCKVTTNYPAPSSGAGLTVGEIALAPTGLTVNAPLLFTIPPGESSATVQITVSDVAAPTTFAIIAGLNGGTRVTSVTIDPGTPVITASLLDKGVESPGVEYIDVKLTDTGNGNAQPVVITGLTFQTLTGTGTVTIANSTPALPINAGNLIPGASTTVRLYLNVPSTVKRFSITENGTVTSLAGTVYNFSNGQSVIP